MKIFAAIAALTTLAFPALAQKSVYTSTQGSACRDRGSKYEFNIWQCPGPAGYAAEFADEGNIVGVAIGRPNNKGKLGPLMSWRGAGRVLGDKLEWRLVNDKPVAAILRIWRVSTDPEGNDRIVQELLVMRLSPRGACRAGAVDAHKLNANLVARQLADVGMCITSNQLPLP